MYVHVTTIVTYIYLTVCHFSTAQGKISSAVPFYCSLEKTLIHNYVCMCIYVYMYKIQDFMHALILRDKYT